MSETKRLGKEISKALNGEAWHGPSWKEILDGVGREAAVYRPIPDGHTLAEVVLHATTWHDVVKRRLEGETPEVTGAEDWPVATFADEAAWSAAVARLFETGKALQATVEAFPEAKLHEMRTGVGASWYELISGELQHILYHAGQAAILKKASVKVPA